MATTTTKKTSKVSSKWDLIPSEFQKKHKAYSSDDLINAYLQGRNDQKDEEKRILIKELINNFEKAKKIGEEFYDFLWSKKIKCKYVLLRARNIAEFETIFIVPKNDYLSYDFLDIYQYSINKKAEINTDTFHFSFSFMPFSSHINTDKLSTDGFVLKYVK